MHRPTRPNDLSFPHPPPPIPTPSTHPHTRSRSCDTGLRPTPPTNPSSSSPLLTITPPPAYIASSAASRLITSDHAADQLTISISPAALLLINQFLDFLLFSLLQTGNGTSLFALRPAVTEVLRVRLAREALEGADHELQSYLGGELDEEIEYEGTQSGGIDADAVWRKARVQCMVYSSLGDTEEDDEAFSLENGLEGIVGAEQYVRQSGIVAATVVGPAVAIWITSVLEFVGEQCLLVAGHAAVARIEGKGEEDVGSGGSVMVEELDAEKVALNPSLGRMWRQWRKKVRGSSYGPSSRGRGALERHVSLGGRGGTRSQSLAPSVSPSVADSSVGSFVEEEKEEEQAPGEPVSIEIPEIAVEDVPESPRKQRPRSLIMVPWTHAAPFSFFEPRRPRSLPDLQRGDFADPGLDGEITVEEKPRKLSTITTPDRRIAEDEIPVERPEEEWEPAPAASGDALFVQRESPKKEMDEVREDDEVSFSPINAAEPEEAPITASLNRLSLAPSSNHTSAKSSRENLSIQIPLKVAPAVREISIKRSPEAAKAMSPEIPPRSERRPDTAKTTATTSTDYEVSYHSPVVSQRVMSISGPRMLEEVGRKSSMPSTSEESRNWDYGHRPTGSISDRRPGQVTLVNGPASPGMYSHRSGYSPTDTRRSSSFSKPFSHPPRQTHSSSSTSSSSSSNKLKKPLPPSSPGLRKSDTESRSSLQSDRRLQSLDEKERSFEELILGGGTIHYTITPDPLRNPLPSPTITRRSEDHRVGTSYSARSYRSSGPTSPKDVLPGLTTSRSSQSANATSRLIDRSPPSSSYQQPTPSLRTARSEQPINNKPKIRLEARDAVGLSSAQTTEALVEFFRTTKPPPGSPPTIISRPPVDPESYPSSYSSTSALIAKRNNIPQQPISPSYGTSGVPSTVPIKKNRFNGPRDPYALDLSEDEDSDFSDDLDSAASDLITPPSAARPPPKQESLIDFLNSMPPPPSTNTPVQPFNLSQSTKEQVLAKKASSVSLMGRFGRGRKESIDSTSVPPRTGMSAMSGATASTAAGAAGRYALFPPQPQGGGFGDQYPGITARRPSAQSGMSGVSVGSRNPGMAEVRGMGAEEGGYSAMIVGGAGERQGQGGFKRKLLVKDARGAGGGGGTESLAEFLRGPPPPAMGVRSNEGRREEEAGEGKRGGVMGRLGFGKKKGAMGLGY